MKKVSALKKIAVITMLTFCIGSCKKKDTTPAPIIQVPVKTTAKFYFQATINGTKVIFQEGIGGYGSGAGDESGTVSQGYQEVQMGELTLPHSSKSSGGFEIMKTDTSYLSTNTQPSGSFIEAMFSVKSYSYGKEGSDNTAAVDGAKVFYIDDNGVMWTTDFGSGVQTNSTFNITEHIADAADEGASIHHISKATFSCILYNSNGESMTLTNGICRSRTVLY